MTFLLISYSRICLSQKHYVYVPLYSARDRNLSYVLYTVHSLGGEHLVHFTAKQDKPLGHSKIDFLLMDLILETI